MNKKRIRINKLIGILKQNPEYSIKELATMLNVSEMTIRRDLAYLESNQVMVQDFGLNFANSTFIPMNTNMITGKELSSEAETLTPQKDEIGKFAANLIDFSDVVILDSGVSIAALSRYIPENKNITVLCYNYFTLSNICNRKDVSVIFSGGYYHPMEQMFESIEGINLIKNHRATKVFLSASGVHERLGITCENNYEVLTKRAAIDSSLTKILLVDSSKFGLIRNSFFAHLSEIDIIITDDGITEEWKNTIEDSGIKLYTV